MFQWRIPVCLHTANFHYFQKGAQLERKASMLILEMKLVEHVEFTARQGIQGALMSLYWQIMMRENGNKLCLL